MRQLASEAKVNCESMRKIICEDLKMKPFHLQKRQLLSAATTEKRLIQTKLLLKWVKCHMRTSIIWSDEKIFTVEQAFNNHNDWVLAKNLKQVPVNERSVFPQQKPDSVVVWTGITSCGKKTPLIFIPEGIKVNQTIYLDMLRTKVLPWANSDQ